MVDDTNQDESGVLARSATGTSSDRSLTRRAMLGHVGLSAGVGIVGGSMTTAAAEGSTISTTDLDSWRSARLAHATLDRDGLQIHGQLQRDGLFPSLFDAHAVRLRTGEQAVDALDPVFVAIPYSGYGVRSGSGMLFSVVVEDDGRHKPVIHRGAGVRQPSTFGLATGTNVYEFAAYGVVDGSTVELASTSGRIDSQAQDASEGQFLDFECMACELAIEEMCGTVTDPANPQCDNLCEDSRICLTLCDLFLEVLGEFLCDDVNQTCELLEFC